MSLTKISEEWQGIERILPAGAMMSHPKDAPVLRFAPSPNGALHLGHAYSAFLNRAMADAAGGRLLLRIEDIDTTRCTPDHEKRMRADLDWLGIRFDGPVRRQSAHFDEYRAALDRLAQADLVYPAFMSRGDVRAAIARFEADGRRWPRDPDGAPLYPEDDRMLSEAERERRIAAGEPFTWRLDMGKALSLIGKELRWQETGAGPEGETGRVRADPRAWGDVVLARRDTPTSYHLSVVVDDALQGITHVVRGRDLFHATAVHRVLQVLLDLPEPIYRHHKLILAEDGNKLSKSRGHTGIAALREAGKSPESVRRDLGFS